MAEYLRIQNFGPIIDIEIDNIVPFTILIGESGSGKSTVMKVLSMFRWIYKRVVLRSYVRQAGIRKTDLGIRMKTLLKTSQLNEYIQSDSEIIYRKDNYTIAYANGKLNAQADIPANQLSLEKICYISDKRSMIPDFLENKIDKKNANYHLQDTLSNFLLAADSIKQLSLDYLHVELKIEKSNKGDQYVIKGTDGNSFSLQLRNASSGTQTVTPLSLIVEYYAKKFDSQKSMNESLFKYLQDNDKLDVFNTTKNIGEINAKNVHLFIEEPELSLYPESQSQLIDFLVDRCFMTEHPYNMTLMMATHSPYIVNYINVLIRRSKETGRTFLNPDKVNVYEIYDGYAGPLKSLNGRAIIDTRSMSDPITAMYSEFNAL
ncbi:MAG: AAA family ATPase [Parabacteroides sp.]|nr:AAA family ATPase [Parabacteroides sp.]